MPLRWITWPFTIAEIAFGYWLTTVDWPVSGGILIGLALGTQLNRIVRRLPGADGYT